MKSARACLIGFMFAAAAIDTTLAHHSFIAEFDPDKPLVLQGVVSQLDWTNPHARFFILVKREGGDPRSWQIQLGSPNTLIRYGWKRDTLKPGDIVTVDGYVARDGQDLVNAKTVKLSDGRTIAAGSSFRTGNAPGL